MFQTQPGAERHLCPSPTRKLFQSIEGELETVEVEGWQAFALRDSLESMQSSQSLGSVILLPLFDAYVMGIGRGAEIDPLLPKAYQKLVYRPQGWISAVVLEDGGMKGVWETKNQRTRTVIQVHLFSLSTTAIKRGIEAEVERLSGFWGIPVAVEYT